MNYYLEAMKKYATLEGRARRKEFWMFALMYAVFYTVASVVDMIAGTYGIFGIIYMLASIIPCISVTVRRLHDIGKPGTWFFISFIPIVGQIWILVLVCKEGDHGINKYGLDPKL